MALEKRKISLASNLDELQLVRIKKCPELSKAVFALFRHGDSPGLYSSKKNGLGFCSVGKITGPLDA